MRTLKRGHRPALYDGQAMQFRAFRCPNRLWNIIPAPKSQSIRDMIEERYPEIVAPKIITQKIAQLSPETVEEAGKL